MGKILGIVIIIVLVVGGFLYFNKSKATTPTYTKPVSMDKNEVNVNLSEQNESGESGFATLSEKDGKVTVTIKTEYFNPGIAQPAHIHVGGCPGVGAVKYPLENVLDGMSVTILETTIDQIKSELPLALNIHKSAAESKIYTSCGDLSF